MTALLVAVGAAVGVTLRFVVGRRLDRTWPIGTLLVNVAGSCLLGMCSGWSLDGAALGLVGVGFCGGLTTYSAFAVQTVALGGWRGPAYATATIGLGLGACALGFLVAQA